MTITIHRGTDQIGGCVTEYEYNGWRLFVDYGEQLPGAPKGIPLAVEGLTHGDISKSALLITHYHGDHVGCVTLLPEELPIFMGETTKAILRLTSEHAGYVDETQKILNRRLESVQIFSGGDEFEWGEFKIMPIVIDHSAFDAYAFKIEAGGLKVFHTGDFRTHGFRGGTLPKVIEKYVGWVDYIVCEATNVSRSPGIAKPEYELQKEFTQAFTENKFNVVYVSSTNIDRLFGLYHAALKAGRPFYVDKYQKDVMDIVAGRNRIWGKSRLYRYKEGREPIVLQRAGDKFKVNVKFFRCLSEHGYVVIARGGDRFNHLLSHIPSEGRKTYFSMWRGYLDLSNAAYNHELAQSVPHDYEYLHTSGHCDMSSLENLFQMLSPKAVIPIHTASPLAFAELFCDRWPVLMLQDGDTFRPIRYIGYYSLTANVLAKKELADNIQVVANPDNLKVWSIDDRCLGEFQNTDDAEWALRHVKYAPERLLGYKVEGEKLDPIYVNVYDADFNLMSSFIDGDYYLDEENWQDNVGYHPGDKVYGIYDAGFNVIIPCEIIGPLTEEYNRKCFEEDEMAPNTYEEYTAWADDWFWDSLIVRPLVQLKNGFESFSEFIEVNRVYLFPWIS